MKEGKKDATLSNIMFPTKRANRQASKSCVLTLGENSLLSSKGKIFSPGLADLDSIISACYC